MSATLTLCLFSAALLLCVALGKSTLYALLFGYVLFFLYGLLQHKSALQLLRCSLRSVKSIWKLLVTFLLIGVVTGVWRASGTIAYLIYHAANLLSPSILLPCAFLLCCLLSFLTGTSFGTAATMGVICMTMARAMGVSPMLAGGAMLSGCFFGDRCSPMSTSALLVCQVTGSDLHRNLRRMLRTGLVPFVLAFCIYALLGVLFPGTGGAALQLQQVFAAHYRLSAWTLLPALLVLLLSLLRCNVQLALLASTAAALLVGCFVQGLGMGQLLSVMVSGFHPQDASLAALMQGGGVFSMGNVALIVCVSSSYDGLFRETGLLGGLQGVIARLRTRMSRFGVMTITAIVTSVIGCNQTLAIMLTQQLCHPEDADASEYAVDLEDTAVVIAPLVPWSIAGATPLATAGAPTGALLFACYLYLLPLCGVIRNRKKKPAAAKRAAK